MPGLAAMADKTTRTAANAQSGSLKQQQQHQQRQQQQQQPLPPLQSQSQIQRPPSPPPPPASPITPTLRLPPDIAPAVPVPTAGGSSTRYTAIPSPSAVSFFAANRPALVHLSQSDQSSTTCGTAPPPRPLDFDTNPDVLALKSAISILQIQRARAQGDIAALSRAKNAALQDPLAFVQDLQADRVATAPNAPTISGSGRPGAFNHSSDSSSSEDDDDDDGEANGNDTTTAENNGGTKGKRRAAASSSSPLPSKPDPPPWRNLPSAQNIVRCPPINWSQYAVVGESLDKLHNQQVARPNPGAPATFSPAGVYEFKAPAAKPGTPGPPLVGVAAPYDPQRDKLDKRTKKAKAPT